jgi:hypothetical protein
MKSNEVVGTCTFCGQQHLISEDVPESERDKAATAACECYESRKTVDVAEQIQKGKQCINQLFVDEEDCKKIGFFPIENKKNAFIFTRSRCFSSKRSFAQRYGADYAYYTGKN